MGRKATKWLRRSVTVMPAGVSRASPEGVQEISGSNLEALQCLKSFWRDVWHLPAEPEELRRLRSGICNRTSSV